MVVTKPDQEKGEVADVEKIESKGDSAAPNSGAVGGAAAAARPMAPMGAFRGNSFGPGNNLAFVVPSGAPHLGKEYQNQKAMPNLKLHAKKLGF